MILKTLQEIGLSEKEAKIFTLLIEYGIQPASNMAKHCNIPRTSAKFLLDTLAKKGFVSKTDKSGTTHYIPKKPETLKRALLNQAEKMHECFMEKVEKLENISPLISEKVEKNPFIPKLTFNEGTTNVIQSFDEFLDGIPPGETIYNCVFPAPVGFKKFREGMQKFIKKRIAKDIFCKTICAYCEDAIRLKMTDGISKRETAITFKNNSPEFFSEVLIWKDRVLDVAYSAQYSIFSYLSMSEDIASMRRSMFELSWEKAQNDTESILKTKEVEKWMDSLTGITEY